MCQGCKYYFEDMSCNDCDCSRIEDMTEEEYDEFWVEDKDGCPYREEDYGLVEFARDMAIGFVIAAPALIAALK